jgi:F-type H+-transporting ATPase subunit delta
MGTVSVRYARALLLYALEQGESEQVYADMQALVERLRFIPAIRERIVDPTVSAEKKQRMLEIALTDGKRDLSVSTTAFFRLVINAGRGDRLLFMATSYQSLYRIHNGIVPVQLVTAVPVGDKYRDRLKKLVEKVKHGKMEWMQTVDPSIEGGFVLQIDGYRLDASVATRLRRLRKELIDKNNRII